jgi:hypothetical protein
VIKQLPAYLLYSEDYKGNPQYILSLCELKVAGYVTVNQQQFDVEIPDDFDPRKLQVEALREEKQRISAEFARRCTQIEEQINKLTALEYT